MSSEQNPPQQRQKLPGDRKEWTVATFASLAGASAMVWTLSSAWVGFRDGILTELAACTHRNELVVAKVEQYYRERDPWLKRIELLERQREQLSERLQAALNRVRDLELSKRP